MVTHIAVEDRALEKEKRREKMILSQLRRVIWIRIVPSMILVRYLLLAI